MSPYPLPQRASDAPRLALAGGALALAAACTSRPDLVAVTRGRPLGAAGATFAGAAGAAGGDATDAGGAPLEGAGGAAPAPLAALALEATSRRTTRP